MLLLGYFAFGFLSLPMWVWYARRVGKLNAYLASFFLGISGGAAMFLLRPGDTWWLMVLICWAGIGFGAGLFLTPSMQADVIDYDELLHRQTARGAVHRVLVDAAEVRRDSERGGSDRDSRLARLHPQRHPGSACGLCDQSNLRARSCDLLRAFVSDRAALSDHRNDSQRDPRRHRRFTNAARWRSIR